MKITNRKKLDNSEIIWVVGVSELSKKEIAKRYNALIGNVKKINRDTASIELFNN